MKLKELWQSLLAEMGVHLGGVTKLVDDFKEEYRHEHVRALAEEAVKAAEKANLVLTIERRPVGLAMRSHAPVIEIRERLLRPTDPDVVVGADGKLSVRK